MPMLAFISANIVYEPVVKTLASYTSDCIGFLQMISHFLGKRQRRPHTAPLPSFQLPKQ